VPTLHQLAPLARLDWLVGEGVEPDLEAGSYNRLIWNEKQVGLILRTRKGVKPLYVSPGHRVTLPECLEITLGCVTRYRLPVPVRQADLLSRRLRAYTLGQRLWDASPAAVALKSCSRYNGQTLYPELLHRCCRESHSHQRQFSQTPRLSRLRQIRPTSPKLTITPSPPEVSFPEAR
jgi:hypothetical protein